MGAPEPSDTSTIISINLLLNQTRNLHIHSIGRLNDSAVFFLACKTWNRAREGQKIGQVASCLSEIKFDQMPSMNPFFATSRPSLRSLSAWIAFKLICCKLQVVQPLHIRLRGVPAELRGYVQQLEKMIYTDQKSIYVHSSAAYGKNWNRKKKGSIILDNHTRSLIRNGSLNRLTQIDPRFKERARSSLLEEEIIDYCSSCCFLWIPNLRDFVEISSI